MGASSRGTLLVFLWGACSAQAEGIYTCVDAKGRRLTADRPIPECLDREQKELTPGGMVKRRILPPPTAEERAAAEDKARKAIEERLRLDEDRKRDRALLLRYPTKDVHDKERALALGVVQEMIVAADKRTRELAAQRKQLDGEAEFYKADPAKAPAKLKRQIEENEQLAAAQKRFTATQEAERQRINARFDEELGRLKQLWSPSGAPAAALAPNLPASSSAVR